eukprot:10054105-Alexandrium_andersonii.AAC.1
MSASLVGSEMCIRDRALIISRNQTALVDPRGAGRQALVLTFTRGAGTVSYTHLTLPTICSV